MSFSYKFDESTRGKTVAFAYAVPYSYTDLKNDLHQIRLLLLEDEQADVRKDTQVTSALPHGASYASDVEDNAIQAAQGGQGAQLKKRIPVEPPSAGVGRGVKRDHLEIQHHQIKREGMQQIQYVANQFELEMAERQVEDLALNVEQKKTFEIYTSNLYYK